MARAGAFAALSACSSSALVRPDDATFARAERRLETAAAAVDALAPPATERAMFLQAEGFYRYRFTPPRRGALSYVAEVAAAVTDFPAFQSLAGSLDLVDLRLRSSDSAIQLWESLLANRPTTVLRPLTLYRLGWAYRDSSAAGLPRASGDEAWAVLAAEAPGTRFAALAVAAKAVPAKSKSTAAGWSAIPGAGELYVGDHGGGAIHLSLGLASLAAIGVPVALAYDRRADLTWRRDWPLVAASFVGLIGLSIDYTVSYEGAMRGVVEWNERAEAAFEDAHPDAP
jgi:hypothetical protein